MHISGTAGQHMCAVHESGWSAWVLRRRVWFRDRLRVHTHRLRLHMYGCDPVVGSDAQMGLSDEGRDDVDRNRHEVRVGLQPLPNGCTSVAGHGPEWGGGQLRSLSVQRSRGAHSDRLLYPTTRLHPVLHGDGRESGGRGRGRRISRERQQRTGAPQRDALPDASSTFPMRGKGGGRAPMRPVTYGSKQPPSDLGRRIRGFPARKPGELP